MGRTGQFAAVLLFLAALQFGHAQEPQTRVKLTLSHEAARPGETVTAALEITSNPGWHTYWRNPGDAGLATSIEWELPSGSATGAIQWPVPKKTQLLQLGSYAYDGTEVLLIPIHIGANASPGAFELRAKVSWLECAETCNPRDAEVRASITIGNDSKASAEASIIDKARKNLPLNSAPFAVTARWENTNEAKRRNLVIEWKAEGAINGPDFFPYEAESYTVQTETKVESADVTVRLKKPVTLGDDGANWPDTIAGLVVNDTTARDPVAFEVLLRPAGDSMAAISTPTAARGPGANSSLSVWAALGLAFLGGFILNIMPCVLPVIALKILSFVNQNRTEPKRARHLGLVYAAGVLASFLVLAGFLIVVQKAGQIASWGMQFQNPVFLVVMITLVTLIALNLFGVFEVTLGGKAMGTASELASKEGSSGAFFNGVLATVLGTSCTAPFLAVAIGYALGQPPVVVILMFLVMGVGLAFPYVVLTWNPGLLRLLPKPGAWMEKFKIAMGFPMLATAVWLYSVAVEAHFGTAGSLWLAMHLVIVALAAWIFGAFIQRGGNRGLATVLAAGALVFAVGFILEKQLSWRNPDYSKVLASGGGDSGNGVNWQKWSHEAVAKARAEGRPVLVDFTASWCANCQVNKKTSIEIESVKTMLKEINGIAMIGDFTRKDPIIAEELKKFERYAVPLVLIYSPDTNEAPKVLPPTLTPGIVLEALQWAGKNKAPSATLETNALAVTK